MEPMDKPSLRKELRAARRAHVAALPDAVRGLMFSRPPSPVLAAVPEGAVIGLYSAVPGEAPALGYAKWFYEAGHRIALPWFADREAGMEFREWANPFLEEEGLEDGPFGIRQPPADAAPITPDVCFVPLLGFTATRERIGQGAGHYDRWLAANPGTRTIGLAWDCQLVDALPVEPHDVPLDMVVTPTRAYGEHA
jgi:5-formyltetrahydrofolate cyclo-ligase